MNSVEQSATEEQWNLRQKTAALDAEKVAFEREKTFTREKLAAEEKRIQACGNKVLWSVIDSVHTNDLLVHILHSSQF